MVDKSQEEKNKSVEPFKTSGELREFIGSTNIETIYQGALWTHWNVMPFDAKISD